MYYEEACLLYILFQTTGIHRSLGTDRIENTAPRGSCIVACVSVAVGACLPCRCLAMAASSGSAIPLFRRYVTMLSSSSSSSISSFGCVHLGSYNLSWFLLSLHGEKVITTETRLLLLLKLFCFLLHNRKVGEVAERSRRNEKAIPVIGHEGP
jgi:hypothetical protein